MAIAAERIDRIDRVDRLAPRPTVDIAPPGYALAVSWAPVPGATKAEVTSAPLTLYPAVVEETHVDATLRADGGGWSIDVPARRRVSRISLRGFKQPGGSTLSDALPAGMRLSVAFPPVSGGGFDSPRFSVPQVGRDHAVPPTLTGASFSGGVISLSKATAASRVRVALVDGANPSEFNDQPTELTRVNLTTHAVAANATVTGPDGAVLWQMPEFDPDLPAAQVDLRHAFEAALNARLAAGEPLETACIVAADAPARMSVVFGGVSGALVRVDDGIVRSVVEGDPAALAVEAFAAETPSSAIGDLTIRYDGIRILETVSDPLPGGPLSGVIVGQTAALRGLPPRALESYAPARIGLFGRAPEDCELSVEFVAGAAGGATDVSATPALTAPAVIAITAASGMRTHWAELPAGAAVSQASGIRVRANRGRFFWAFNANSEPLVRLAVLDPDPGGRPLWLGDSTLVAVDALEAHRPAFAFPTGVFAQGPPAFSSDLFLTVDVSDLTLRYGR